MPSWVDITAITLAVIIVLLSLKNGLFRSLLDLAAIVFSLALAHLSYAKIIASFPALEQSALAYALIVFASWFSCFNIIEIALSVVLRIININLLLPLDKLGAVLAGFLKFFLIAGFIFRLLLFVPLSPGIMTEIQTSYAARWFRPVFNWSYAQAEKIAGIPEYKFTKQAVGKKARVRDPLVPQNSLDDLKKILPMDLQSKEMDLPKLRLELEKALGKDQ